MENNEKKTVAKTPDSEHYDPENPQEQNLPKYNSTSAHRTSEALPAVENLNEIKDEKNQLKQSNTNDSASSTPINDESLHGKRTSTDLGAGQREDDEDENEKIIST